MNRMYGDCDIEEFRTNSVTELYAYEDVDFIRRAYVTILGRFPEGDGERYYLSRLRTGYSKIHLLNQIYRSSENKNTVLSVVGLHSMLRRHRRASWYGVRWLYRALGYTEGNSASERQNRALLRELAGIREGIAQLNSGLNLTATAARGFSDVPPDDTAKPLSHEISNPASVARQGKQSLKFGGQDFILPLSTDSRTRRLAAALEREILFTKRAV